MTTIGCIGCGNMGGAIMRGLSQLELDETNGGPLRLLGVDPHPERLEACGVAASDLPTIARAADIIIVAVKPHGVESVLKQLFGPPRTRSPLPIVVSVAAGITTGALRGFVDGHAAVVRCMPNTPVGVGMGSFALCLEDPLLSQPQRDALLALFNRLGRALLMPEAKFPAFSALVGCGPAYMFHFFESLAEAGVIMGFSRADAISMVSYLAAGSAKLAMEPGAHPALLREAVCSPGGSTIQGIAKLDEHAVRASVVQAVHAAWEKEKAREK